jgi:hypothetical protein
MARKRFTAFINSGMLKASYTSSLRPHTLVAAVALMARKRFTAFINSGMRSQATGLGGLKLLVHEALSYQGMRP